MPKRYAKPNKLARVKVTAELLKAAHEQSMLNARTAAEWNYFYDKSVHAWSPAMKRLIEGKS